MHTINFKAADSVQIKGFDAYQKVNNNKLAEAFTFLSGISQHCSGSLAPHIIDKSWMSTIVVDRREIKKLASELVDLNKGLLNLILLGTCWQSIIAVI